MPVNITQQRICRVISQQMLYFSQHFAEKFCPENACRVMFTDICCHLTDMTFLGEKIRKNAVFRSARILKKLFFCSNFRNRQFNS